MSAPPSITIWTSWPGSDLGAGPRDGAGIGGLAVPLCRRGAHVWAVEYQPGLVDILSNINAPNLTVVPALVEEADLPTKFQLVIMSSHIINLVGPSQRYGLYASAVKHMDPDRGVLALEVNCPDWFRKAVGLDARGLRVEYDEASRPRTTKETYYNIRLNCEDYARREDRWTGTVLFEFSDVAYLERFTTHLLEVDDISRELEPHGLVPASPAALPNVTDMELLYTFRRTGLYFEDYRRRDH